MTSGPLAPDAGIAIITPSYHGDLERCRLLCDTLDQAGGERWHHLILVADGDLPLFREFAGPRRQIIPDSAYMPHWLKPVRGPISGRMRWFSFNPLRPVWPMSGWHVQQIRKLFVARLTEAPLLLMADSDTVFIKPVTTQALVRDGKARLYRRQAGITATDLSHGKHLGWLQSTGQLLGLEAQPLPTDDYINNLVTWRRDVALALIDHVETRAGRDLAAAMGRHRGFSEYLLYGQFADRILGGKAGHWHSEQSLGHTYWSGAALDDQGLDQFLAKMEPQQIAFGIQSFTRTSLDLIRRRLGAGRSVPAEASATQAAG